MRATLLGYFVLFYVAIANSQSFYNVRLSLSKLDTVSNVACYDLQIQNGGKQPWNLANYNLGIFFDAKAAKYLNDSLILDDVIYDQSVTSFVSSVKGSPLSYQDSLGFIRVGLSSNDFGTLVDTLGTWLSTVRLCFQIKFTNITSPGTCLQMNFVNLELRNTIMVPPNILQRSDSISLAKEVTQNLIFDNLADRRLNSCFVLEENTPDLCSDGIDNDEDGKADCDDAGGCSVGNVSITLDLPDCFDTFAVVTLHGFAPKSLFSFDGLNFVTDTSFMGLKSGNYEIYGRINNIVSCEFFSPISISPAKCDEFDQMACSDIEDNDGDGLVDCADSDCLPDISRVSITELNNCQNKNNAAIKIHSRYSNLEFSIDGGINYQSDSSFSSLSAGSYVIQIRNISTKCIFNFANNPVRIDSLNCPPQMENCSDNEDNDGDGLIDCLDPDCLDKSACKSNLSYYLPNSFSPSSRFNNRFGLTLPDGLELRISSFDIFDRWGNLVFSKKNTSNLDSAHSWDGRINSGSAPPGLYTYLIIFSQLEGIAPISGTITLIN